MKKSEAYFKLHKVVSNCNNMQQLDNAIKMCKNFLKMYDNCFIDDSIDVLITTMRDKLSD